MTHNWRGRAVIRVAMHLERMGGGGVEVVLSNYVIMVWWAGG